LDFDGAGGVETPELEAGGVETPEFELDVGGVETPGVETGGVDSPGVEICGVDSAGLEGMDTGAESLGAAPTVDGASVVTLGSWAIPVGHCDPPAENEPFAGK